MEIRFDHTVYLWFLLSLVILVALHFVTLRNVRRRALRFANFEAIERVTGAEVLSKNMVILYIRLLIIVCIIFAISGPIFRYVGKVQDANYVLAIDASNSMKTEDVKPNRLEVAKQSAILFVDLLKAKTNVAVISFSGSAFVEQDATDDFLKVKNAIKGIELRFVGGSDILDAVVAGTNQLARTKTGQKVIILLTDGQININTVYDVVDYASKNGVTINTIAVGTLAGGPLVNISSGNVVSKLDEESLQSISYGTGGKYFRAESRDKLVSAYQDIAISSTGTVTVNLSPFMILLALVLLLVEWFLINTRYRTLP